MKYMKFNNKMLLMIIILFSSNATAEECKIKINYSNGPFSSSLIGVDNFVVHHDSTQTTLRKHMRVIKNTGEHSIRIKYWDISGNHWRTITSRSTKRISGDLKKIECLGRNHSPRPSSSQIRCKAGGGMDLAYNARSNKLTVRFARTRRGRSLSSLSRGQCSLVGITSSVSKFCHSGINDMIWKLNTRSINVSSRKAPYAIKIKNGGVFTLRVRNISNGCINVR